MSPAAQLTTELESCDDEQEEVARVVRQTDLLDNLAHREVHHIASPCSVVGHVDRLTVGVKVLAVRKHVVEEVDDGGRQGGEDDVERHGE